MDDLTLPLTDQERRFVRHYVATLDARTASQLAGYRDRAAGARLLRDARVQAEVQAMLRPRLTHAGVTKNRVIQRLADIGFADIRDLFDRDTGRLKAPADLSDAAAAQLSGIKVQRTRTIVPDGAPDGTYVEESIIEVKRIDPVQALTVLAKHTGAIGDAGERRDSTSDVESVRLDPASLSRMSDQQIATLARAVDTLDATRDPGTAPSTPVPAGDDVAG